MDIVSVVGARPQFIKVAPFCRAVAAHNSAAGGAELRHFLLHTGQHYDADMSDVFFDELDIPRADLDLGIGSASHARQTAGVLTGVEDLLLERKPDVVVVFGDTNSTIAAALAASKLDIPSVHVEAGLRSRDRRMPEEINRIVADHLAELNLAPTPTAMVNLRAEGLAERSVQTGDIMLDAVRQHLEVARERSDAHPAADLSGHYAIATIHRADNTEPERLRSLLDTLARVAREHLPVLFPVHPRTRAAMRACCPDFVSGPHLRLVDPLGYLDMLQALSGASIALTDSGGLQKEAFFLGVPCVTLRDTTEWQETVDVGANVIVGAEPDAIEQAVAGWQMRRAAGEVDFQAKLSASFGDGHAAEKIVAAIRTSFAPKI